MHGEVWEGWVPCVCIRIWFELAKRRTSCRMNRRSSVSIILLARGLGSGSCRLANCSKNDARQDVRAHFLSGVTSAVAITVLASSHGDQQAGASLKAKHSHRTCLLKRCPGLHTVSGRHGCCQQEHLKVSWECRGIC